MSGIITLPELMIEKSRYKLMENAKDTSVALTEIANKHILLVQSVASYSDIKHITRSVAVNYILEMDARNNTKFYMKYINDIIEDVQKND